MPTAEAAFKYVCLHCLHVRLFSQQGQDNPSESSKPTFTVHKSAVCKEAPDAGSRRAGSGHAATSLRLSAGKRKGAALHACNRGAGEDAAGGHRLHGGRAGGGDVLIGPER